MDVAAQPWSSIVAFYRALTHLRPELAPMLSLCERIAASPWASGLHATTMAEVLMVAQTPVFDPQQETLQIGCIGGRVAFDFVESVFESRRWRARVEPDEAFAAFERFLAEKRWFGL
jgi:hypothetical protein